MLAVFVPYGTYFVHICSVFISRVIGMGLQALGMSDFLKVKTVTHRELSLVQTSFSVSFGFLLLS